MAEPMDQAGLIVRATENKDGSDDEQWLRAVPRPTKEDPYIRALADRPVVLGSTLTALAVLVAFGAFAWSFAGYAAIATGFIP